MTCEHDVGCITCGDTAVELRVDRIDAAAGLARCLDEAGQAQIVETALVGALKAGDTVLVHAGTAIQVIGAGA